MRRVRLILSTAGISIVALIALSCGSSGRVLQSVTVTPTSETASASNGQVQFVATGHFNKAPMTVSPMPVNWTGSWAVVPPICINGACAGMNPDGVAMCFAPGTATITATAPQDPDLPLTAINTPKVTGTATLICQ